jgi:hypothetical protein
MDCMNDPRETQRITGKGLSRIDAKAVPGAAVVLLRPVMHQFGDGFC